MAQSKLRETYQKVLPLLGKIKGLNGIDIGYRFENSEQTDCLVVRFHVAESFIRDTELMRIINSNSIQLIEGKYCLSFSTLNTTVTDPNRIARRDPIQPGISVGCFECGTLGLFVKDVYTDTVGFITCYHVVSGWQGIEITQPGPGTDGGNFTLDTIGTLERFIPYEVGYDAAFVKLIGARKFDNTQFGTKDVLRTPGEMKIGDVLTKSGRTTGVSQGKVVGKGSFSIDYPFYGTQIISAYSIAPMGIVSQEGDSGAVWYDDSKAAMGLHFATDTKTSYALACSLQEIFPILQIKPL